MGTPAIRTDEGGSVADATPVVVHIKRVGQELYDALYAVTEQIPAKSRSPQEFARTLKIHRTLAGRLLNAIRTDDPLAAVSRMPRSEGLRMILQGARSTVSGDAISRAETALRTFEEVVNHELGGWDGFDAAITEWLPDARKRFELANKQLAFKGMANLTGVRADVQLDTAIYYPDSTGRRCDIAIIEGQVNLRRLRPSVRVSIAAHTPSPAAPQPLEFLVEDMPENDPGDRYPLLRQFCSSPCPKLEAVQTGDMVNYVLAGNSIGNNSAVDIFAANLVRSGRPLYREPSDPPIRPHWSAGLNLPAKTLLMNILLHEDVWATTDPQLLIYDMHIRGLATPGDPSREFDRIDTVEDLQPLGKGASRFRASEVGQHVEIVQHVCDKLGWNSDLLRGYRVRVQYPLINAQYCIAFDPVPLRRVAAQ